MIPLQSMKGEKKKKESGTKQNSEYPNKKREIFPSEAAGPAIEYAIDVLPVVELHHLVDDLGELPILLPAAALDAKPIPGGDLVLARPSDLDGDAAVALVVVHKPHQLTLVPPGSILPVLVLQPLLQRAGGGFYPNRTLRIRRFREGRG